jgi:TPR repeat protein
MKISNLKKIILLSTILLPILNASAGLSKLDLKVATKGCAKNDLGFCATLANNGDLKAALKIAELSKDLKLKSDWYAFACDKGEPIGCENLCTKKLSSEKPGYVMDGCMKMAEFAGKNAPPNQPNDEQIKWWTKACDNGNMDGCANAGLNTKDPSESSRLLNLACNKKNPRACYVLGFRAREKGDPGSAEYYYGLACSEIFYEDSCNLLKEVKSELEDIRKKNAEMADQAKKAANLAKLAPIKAACESGNLNECIKYGETLEAPADQKIPWFKKACDGGEMEGCVQMGVSLAGLGKFNDAIDLYNKACNRGYSEGCFFAGWTYFNKLNKPADAKKYYLLACNLSQSRACNALGSMESNKGNQAEAAKFYTKACDGGNTTGCNNLASLQIDYNSIAEARKYLNEACDSGSNAACQKLVALTKEFK